MFDVQPEITRLNSLAHQLRSEMSEKEKTKQQEVHNLQQSLDQVMAIEREIQR